MFQPCHKVPSVSKKVLYVRLSYLGNVSSKIESELLEKLTNFYPQICFKFISVNSFKIGSFFTYKDRLPTDLRSSVVYQYTCPSCQAGYFGSTVRAFKMRTDEHRGQSWRTGLRLHNPPHSAVRDHSQVCNVPLHRDHFKIVDSCPSSDLRVLGSLYI